MGRPTIKEDLITVANENYSKLNDIIDNLTEKELSSVFDFSSNNKKEAHWGRDKNLRDILIHLYEWHSLVLSWVESNTKGIDKSFLPAPYNWKTYGDMNVEFFKKHQNTSLEQSKEMFENSHREIMELVENFSTEELFSKESFKWVGGSTLGSYFVSATASHYDWAIKKLKLHIKNCKS